jgi:hypothetical protein
LIGAPHPRGRVKNPQLLESFSRFLIGLLRERQINKAYSSLQHQKLGMDERRVIAGKSSPIIVTEEPKCVELHAGMVEGQRGREREREREREKGRGRKGEGERERERGRKVRLGWLRPPPLPPPSHPPFLPPPLSLTLPLPCPSSMLLLVSGCGFSL